MRPYRVLIVEDNPVIRDLFVLGIDKLREGLAGARREVEVTQAEDGATAWKSVQEAEVDMVVVDLYLPVLNGLDLIRRIRETPRLANTKILAISASIQDARDRSLSAGADQFLQKPLKLVDLLDALKSLLKVA